jgi:hypothetical protein
MEVGVPQVLNLATGVLGGGFLPYDLGALLPNFTGCSAELFPEVGPGLGGQANAQVPLPVPPITTLAGAHLYAQIVVLGSTGAVSPALDVNIQF